jgi:hypothetical protein
MQRPLVRALAIVVATVASMGAMALMTFEPAAANDGGVIRLSPGDTKTITVTRAMATSGEGAGGASVPDDCRNDPQISIVCDAYRLQLDLDTSPGALNFLRFELNWETQRTPPLAAAVLGLNPINNNDLDLRFYDISGPKPAAMTVDGAAAPYTVPEIAAFEARLPTYDFTIESTRGPVLNGYTLTIQFSNELFTSPFEALDPAADGSFTQPVDASGEQPGAPVTALPSAGFDSTAPSGGFNATSVVAPSSAPVQADSDFTGFRGGVDDALSGNLAAFSSGAAAQQPLLRSPSWLLVLFWLVLAPLLLAAVAAWYLRRRRTAA